MGSAFPVAKLAGILIRQIAKPLANVAKARAKTSPFFRNYICMPPAQFYHWWEVRMRMWTMNLGKPVNIPKMNEARAIELGAELVGETLIFAIAAVILVAEYVRSSRKEAAKEEERKQEMLRIHSELKELYFANAKLETEVQELIRVLHENGSKKYWFNPGIPNTDSIPLHHRNGGAVEVEIAGLFSSITNVVWGAMELILPSPDDARAKNSDNHANESSTSHQPSASVTSPKSANSRPCPVPGSALSTGSTKSQDNNPSCKECTSESASAPAASPKL